MGVFSLKEPAYIFYIYDEWGLGTGGGGGGEVRLELETAVGLGVGNESNLQ